VPSVFANKTQISFHHAKLRVLSCGSILIKILISTVSVIDASGKIMIGIKCVKKIYEPVGKPPNLRNTLLINSHYLDDTYSGYNLFLRQKNVKTS
jgi:hypothetical protein